MDLYPTGDQLLLIELVTAFAADRYPIETLRSYSDLGIVDRSRWRELAALGTFGLSVGESHGGLGSGFIDSVLVHEVLGEALVPGPLIPATLSAGLVDGVLDGSVIPSLLDATLGEPFVIEYFRSSDVLLVLTDGGIGIVSAAEVDGFDSSVPTDPTTPVTVLTSLPKTEPLAGAADSREWRRRGSLLASAQLVGNSAGSTALAVAYAKERQQFGRPIGSFQGLKHLLADSWIRTEVARSSVWSAGVSLDEGSNSFVERALSGGRVTAARAATENAKTCIQVHGGMGFTWEINAHLFLKRAWILETQFGSVDDAVRAVAIDFATEASE